MWRETNVLQEWEVFTFTDVVEVNPKRPLKKGEECPYIEMKSLLPNHKKVEKIDKRAYKGGGSRFRNGDTIFARITPCLENGKIAFVNELDPDQAGYGSTEFIVMSGKEGVTDNLFVYYLSRWDEIRDFAIKNMTGTSGRQRVPNDIFKQRKIYLPPLPEQRRIAAILSAFDDKIELNHQMNRTLEETASAIFKSWFVDFEPFLDGEFEYNVGLEEEIPKGWEVKRIGEVCKTFGGGTPNTNEQSYWDGGDIYWATPTDITALTSPIIFDTARKITQKGLEKSSAKLLPVGAVLMTSRATLGHFAISKVPIATNQGFISIVCGDYPSNYFMLYSVKQKTEQIIGFAGGSTYLEINKTAFRSIQIILPPRKLVRKFDKIVESLYNEIYENERENKTLTQTRDALLPKLMSGEIRVFEN